MLENAFYYLNTGVKVEVAELCIYTSIETRDR
jgi:hypothetical protein